MSTAMFLYPSMPRRESSPFVNRDLALFAYQRSCLESTVPEQRPLRPWQVDGKPFHARRSNVEEIEGSLGTRQGHDDRTMSAKDGVSSWGSH